MSLTKLLGTEKSLTFFSVVDPDPHWEYGIGFGSRRAKINHKREENSNLEVLDVLF
jgi:hypothetical protein